MQESTSKEKVLKKIRNALVNKAVDAVPKDVDFDSPIYNMPDQPLEITFAERFTELTGKFIYCENEDELIAVLKAVIEENNYEHIGCFEEQIQQYLQKVGISYYPNSNDILKVKTGITACEFLVARTGSVVVSSKQKTGRQLHIYPDIHIVIAKLSQLVPDIKDALQGLKERYQDKIPSFISFITGPSRTADIEKTLIIGAHGPKEIYVFLVDDTTY
ncbi:MAG: lactate utilization protein C [Bacteroidia bacterium]